MHITFVMSDISV